ncbi:MAG: AAA family ATPase [Candidatus Heimdallarchaeota archaeon]|nr:AAA family ATPase [Candidatus Heimdallarchaeota archaeon]
MLVKHISLNNWMGHKEISLAFLPGKNLVYGANASGKSSIAKAISFALTGLLPKNTDPRRTDKEMAFVDIIVNFGKKEGDYLLRRQLDKGKKPKTQLFIYDVDELSEALYVGPEAEQFLRERLELSEEIFQRIIYMKEEDVYEFLANPNDAVIKEIDRLIGLEKASRIEYKLLDLKREVNKQTKFITKQISRTKAGIEVNLGVPPEIKGLKPAKIKKRLNEIENEITDVKKLKDYVGKRDGILEELKTIMIDLGEDEPKELEVKLIERQQTAEKDKETLETKQQKAKEILDDLTSQEKEYKATLTLKKNLVEVILEQKSATAGKGICPTCGREMDPKLTEKVLKNLQEELEKLQGKLEELIDNLKKQKNELKKLNHSIEQVNRRIQYYITQKNAISEKLENLRTCESMIKLFEGKNYPQTINGLEKKLEELNEEERELTKQKGILEGAKAVTEEQINRMKKTEEELKHKEKICDLILETITEAKKKLRLEMTSNVKTIAEEIWEKYKNEHWTIDWDDKFVPTAKPAKAGRSLKAYELSGSERFLILLAIRIAFQKSLEQFNLLIIDEPCQHLDAFNGKLFRDVLTAIEGEAIKQSIIFTYNQDFLESEWDNIINLSAQ